MKIGLLMESAQAHQKLVEQSLTSLRSHTQDLDAVVRDAIARTLTREIQEMTAECNRASHALRDMKRAAGLRFFLWNIGVVLVCTLVPVVMVNFMLPSATEIDALRERRDSLAMNVARLERVAGKAQWRECGDIPRLCIRVDRKAPVFGEQSDYFVVKGY